MTTINDYHYPNNNYQYYAAERMMGLLMDPFAPTEEDADIFAASFDADQFISEITYETIQGEAHYSSDHSSGSSSPISTPPQFFNYQQSSSFDRPWTVDTGIKTFVHPANLTYDVAGNCYVKSNLFHNEPQLAEQTNRKRKFYEDIDPCFFSDKTRCARSKVKPNKGGIQCVGQNRKRGCQCKNAALMEYIGPRPQYCAEHIELDPHSLYTKCKSSYQKTPGDKKSCKEVVLKEFGTCYKHFHDLTAEIVQKGNLQLAKDFSSRINEIHTQLEGEANAAKKIDSDLFQRKNKLLPKFAGMGKMMRGAVSEMTRAKEAVRA